MAAGYSFILVLQLLLVGVDILSNSFSVLFAPSNSIVLLVVYLIQDVCLIFSLILLFLVFFNTFAFKAGLICLLVKKFAATLLAGVLYLVLTVAFHIWNVSVRWQRTNMYGWSDGLQAAHVIQKLVAILYYYVYKRAALRLGNPKYYDNSEWFRKHLNAANR